MKNSIIAINYFNSKAYIDLKINNFPENTKDLPETLTVLKKELPSIFTNQCFNGRNLSFYEEVQSTETAHMFEHIILEEMCLAKLKYADIAEYEGRTLWYRNKRNGIYQIELSFSLADWPIFIKALNKSVTLVNIITKNHYIN